MDSRLYPQHNATSPFSPSLPFPFRSSKPLSQNNAVPATTLRPCPPPTTCLNPARVRCSNVAVAEPPAPKLGKWTDIKKILILGAGPIVIGKACEFDYSGTQACKALREEGNEVVLINSNPATIMTGPETVDRTYITPMTPDLVERVLEWERPDALLPTMGGQTPQPRLRPRQERHPRKIRRGTHRSHTRRNQEG
ncbi:hypothetical protein GLYMA_20G148861v4 [Glycine max]|nr:hypothetical protein GLYMA_20G148861v4 [Glycine max]KAH1036171.1 hypothetical protein GYH30_055908 [Glycine max]